MKKLATVGSLIVTSTLVFSSMPFQMRMLTQLQ